MAKIKNVVFDLGGVLIDLDYACALRSFERIGVEDANRLLDPYEQKGIFLEVENGKADAEMFCRKLREHTGKDLSFEAIRQAWLGFVVDVPQYKLDYLLQLRESYPVYLLSNTNPFIMDSWARTEAFTPAGRPIGDYFDKIYASFEIGLTKPDRKIFEYMVRDSGMVPQETLFVDDGARNVATARELGFETYLPENGEDWREAVGRIIRES